MEYFTDASIVNGAVKLMRGVRTQIQKWIRQDEPSSAPTIKTGFPTPSRIQVSTPSISEEKAPSTESQKQENDPVFQSIHQTVQDMERRLSSVLGKE